jgi:phage gpG-like protein
MPRTDKDEPLYTALPRREFVGLTDDEITKLHHEIKAQLMGTYKTEDIYRAIEAKLREKNGL